MANLGLLAPEFDHATLERNLDAIAATGAESVQFDLVCAVGETFPKTIGEALCARIRNAFAERGLTMAALSGTFNMIHPDPAERAAGLAGLRRVIAVVAALGTSVVTLCTGSRDRENMWRWHPDNDSNEAWSDLVAVVREAVRSAEELGVTLGIEPEIANAVDSARKARRLIDEIGSPRLKVVMDGANIFHHGELARMREMLDEAFELVGADIVLGHAKDLDHDGEAGHLAAGAGVLDYRHYLALMQNSGFDGAIILHALTPAEARARLDFVREVAPVGYLTAA
jgi:sugar phosphate isomerase/epimerase